MVIINSEKRKRSIELGTYGIVKAKPKFYLLSPKVCYFSYSILQELIEKLLQNKHQLIQASFTRATWLPAQKT